MKKEVDVLSKLDLNAITAANKKFEQGLKDLHTRAFLSAKANFEAVAKVHPKDAGVKKYLDDYYYGPKDWPDYLAKLGMAEMLDAARRGRSVIND